MSRLERRSQNSITYSDWFWFEEKYCRLKLSRLGTIYLLDAGGKGIKIAAIAQISRKGFKWRFYPLSFVESFPDASSELADECINRIQKFLTSKRIAYVVNSRWKRQQKFSKGK